MANMEARIAQLERNEGIVGERIANLTAATRDNTSAIKDLTNMLSYNKGIIAASVKFAGLMTMIIAAGWAVGTYVASLFHMGGK